MPIGGRIPEDPGAPGAPGLPGRIGTPGPGRSGGLEVEDPYGLFPGRGGRPSVEPGAPGVLGADENGLFPGRLAPGRGAGGLGIWGMCGEPTGGVLAGRGCTGASVAEPVAAGEDEEVGVGIFNDAGN